VPTHACRAENYAGGAFLHGRHENKISFRRESNSSFDPQREREREREREYKISSYTFKILYKY